MAKILTFGEVMLRISPLFTGEKVVQADTFRIEPGGSESNVAIALSNLGERVAFLTKLPDNELSEIIYRYLRKYNVDTSYILTGRGRLGVYYTEHGVGPRPSIVVYDRESSAFSLADFKDFDMNRINKDFSWFHTSGISPAVSKNASETLGKIVSKLKNNLRISIDLNYRKKLWGWVDAPRAESVRKTMLNLCSKAYLLTANETDFQDVFGFNAKGDPYKKYAMIARMAFDKMPKLQFVGISLRESISANENVWSGMLFSRKGEGFKSQVFKINNIVDRVGAGDSFTAGIIHGIINKADPQYTVDFAVALSALKHTIRGDASQFKKSDVEHLLKIGPGGRILR
jgi:2-dehydro-3-deoxygluconokinase